MIPRTRCIVGSPSKAWHLMNLQRSNEASRASWNDMTKHLFKFSSGSLGNRKRSPLDHFTCTIRNSRPLLRQQLLRLHSSQSKEQPQLHLSSNHSKSDQARTTSVLSNFSQEDNHRRVTKVRELVVSPLNWITQGFQPLLHKVLEASSPFNLHLIPN